jgi:hypothetical protein
MMNDVTPATQMLLDRLARNAAISSVERHDYLPSTSEEAEQFAPHEWVKAAIREAYLLGRVAGANGLRSELRALIGFDR